MFKRNGVNEPRQPPVERQSITRFRPRIARCLQRLWCDVAHHVGVRPANFACKAGVLEGMNCAVRSLNVSTCHRITCLQGTTPAALLRPLPLLATLRRHNLEGRSMAHASEKQDKNTPDSKWKDILTAEEVRCVSHGLSCWPFLNKRFSSSAKSAGIVSFATVNFALHSTN